MPAWPACQMMNQRLKIFLFHLKNYININTFYLDELELSFGLRGLFSAPGPGHPTGIRLDIRPASGQTSGCHPAGILPASGRHLASIWLASSWISCGISMHPSMDIPAWKSMHGYPCMDIHAADWSNFVFFFIKL